MHRTPSVVLVASALALGLATLWLTFEITTLADLLSPRTARVLRGYPAEFHATVTRFEDRVPAGSDTPDATWLVHIRAIDDALRRNDVGAAIAAWHHAYGAAFGARKWEAMLAVGDAMRRIAEVARSPHGLTPSVRQAYLVGLIRARRDASVDGVLRLADAFAALGDREIARECFGIAARLAMDRGDRQAAARVREASQRLSDRQHTGSLVSIPF